MLNALIHSGICILIFGEFVKTYEIIWKGITTGPWLQCIFKKIQKHIAQVIFNTLEKEFLHSCPFLCTLVTMTSPMQIWFMQVLPTQKKLWAKNQVNFTKLIWWSAVLQLMLKEWNLLHRDINADLRYIWDLHSNRIWQLFLFFWHCNYSAGALEAQIREQMSGPEIL